MEIGPSVEHRQPWIRPDDDRVEYATLNHQHVPTENQPKCDLSNVGESQESIKYYHVKTIIIPILLL